MDFLIDLPTRYVEHHESIKGMSIECSSFCSSVVPFLDICASSTSKTLLVRDPSTYSPWYVMPPFSALWHHLPFARRAFLRALPVYNTPVSNIDIMPDKMLMDPVSKQILPESMWAQRLVATWGHSDKRVIRDWRFAKGRFDNFIPMCLNFEGTWVQIRNHDVDFF